MSRYVKLNLTKEEIAERRLVSIKRWKKETPHWRKILSEMALSDPRRKTSLKKAQEGQHKSPICQSDEKHHCAKFWSIRDPNGVPHQFKNLCQFIREHPHLFHEEDIVERGKRRTRAMHGLGALRPGRRGQTHQVTSWKGWTWFSIPERRFNDGNDLLQRQTL